MQRTLQRDESNESLIKSIIASQLSRNDRLQRADDIIDNENDIGDLRTKVADVHKQYMELARIGNELDEY